MNTKLFIFLFAIVGLSLVAIQSTHAQDNYSVTVEWTDYNCDCDDPITKEVYFKLYSYPGNVLLFTSDTEEPTSNPWTFYENDDINDCGSDCYMVKAYVTYFHNNVECCSGYIQETCTGQELCNGFTFALVMTME